MKFQRNGGLLPHSFILFHRNFFYPSDAETNSLKTSYDQAFFDFFFFLPVDGVPPAGAAGLTL
jgi:hypothetical protein